ncbi:hypothetical protein ACFYT4_22090 [Streptomyces sp. NPDC004609]|uniref:hypothetical protein n=1 Tax=Streptomyces sp. NPDC004609 TaxID=3364704 RepID=UPI0036BB0E68
MSDLPLPLPHDRIPPGTRDWRSADASRWLAAAPARWAHPLWPTAALVATAVWAIATADGAACTSADPCAADWWGLALAGAALLSLYWVWRLPLLALLGLAVTTAGGVADGGLSGDWWAPSVLAPLFAVAYAVITLVHRLAAARSQRALAEEAAGPDRHRLPPAARNFRRGRVSLAVAALLLPVAAFALWQARQVIGAYEEHAARATPVAAEVLSVEEDDEGATVLEAAVAEGDTTYTVENVLPEDYPVGSIVILLVDGGWVRLAAEPYDIFGWELLLLAAATAGSAFLVNGVTGRLRGDRLGREPLPVLRVLVREGHGDGRTWVYAADDLTAGHPLLSFHSLPTPDDEETENADDTQNADDSDDDAEDEGAGQGGHGEPTEEETAALEREMAEVAAILGGTDPLPPLCEAVLFGAPRAGAELAFVAGEDDGAMVERSVTPARPAVPGPLESLRGGSNQRRERRRRIPVDEIAAGMRPTAAPVSWSADRGSRAVGLLLLLAQGGATWVMLVDGPSWHRAALVIGLPWLIGSVSTALNWRVTADRRGLWVTGAWRVRHVPWERISVLRHDHDSIVVGATGQDDVKLSPTGWSWFQHRLGGSPAAIRAADEARALWHRPELRPERDSAPGEQGMPLGPLIVALGVLWGAAVLLLF